MTIEMELMANGSSYNQQAAFKIASYPYIFKLLFAPVIDSYYFKNFGKCKTYIVTPFYLITCIIFFMAQKSEGYIENLQIGKITVIWFINNLCVVFAVRAF